jgi:hypothetical protein
VFSHDSHHITIRRNFIHGHDRWGHPDNIQFHNGVSEMRVEENVLLDGGQALMMEGVKSGTLVGNLIVGTDAFAVILGHDTVADFTVDRNTIALTGWGAVASTKGHHVITHNLLCPGPGVGLSRDDAAGLESDYNLFWKRPGYGGSLVAVAKKWPKLLPEHQQHTGLDRHSLSADPLFMNAPVFHAAMDSKRLVECTRSRLYLRSDATLFQPGDLVEVKFDGRQRRVTQVGKDFIELDPPLDALPEKGSLVLNWQRNTNLALDFRRREGSPAQRAGANGADIGAALAVPDARRFECGAQGRE